MNDNWILVASMNKTSPRLEDIFEVLESGYALFHDRPSYDYDYDLSIKDGMIHLLLKVFVDKKHVEELKHKKYDEQKN